MKEKTHENNQDALNADIAKLREEIEALAASLKKLVEGTIDKPGGSANSEKGNGGWTGFRHGLDQAGARGKMVAKGLADEIQRHPLLGGMAAFGLGFWIARLLFRGSKRDSGQ